MTIPAAVALLVLVIFLGYRYVANRGALGEEGPRGDERGLSATEPRTSASTGNATSLRSMQGWITASGVALRTSRRRRLQAAATASGSVTVFVLSLFLVGEVAAGDPSGLAHLVEVGPLVLLLALGWFRPSLAGALLLAAGGTLVAFYVFETNDASVALTEQLLVGIIFLLPPVVAGVLFLVASRCSEGDGAKSSSGDPRAADWGRSTL